MPDEITFFDESALKAEAPPVNPEGGDGAVEQVTPSVEPSKEREVQGEKPEN
jgi:hypothetical protein